MVLLVIDVQAAITVPELYAFGRFSRNLHNLLAAARKSGTEVIYVRHDDGAGQPLSAGNPGFEIAEAFAPQPGERIFDKHVNSPFKESGLTEYLRERGETQLIVTGLQTEYCIDATVKCGFEHGFSVIVPEYANTTFSDAYMSGEQIYRYFNDHIWPVRYAKRISVYEATEMMRKR